ncbi:MAG TPA: quinone-dependent dihydroorotate dehydrogenase [Anaerolineales bacterium]|nr:quinone-dependent dihydroorotate dehydrogenase [Anaerolineales bacterium]
MYSRLRPWLFRVDPERAHAATIRLLQLIGAFPPIAAIVRRAFSAQKAESVEVFGLGFANHLGLAAGYDKDGSAWRGLACLGFGHIEIGTITPQPQSGNPKPRLFRLPEDQALVNRMGFPSRGAEFVLKRLHGMKPTQLILGVNLGINKTTPLEKAADDYRYLIDKFNPIADYLVINVSSPNTPGLRQLQGAISLDNLLKELAPLRKRPLLVKLSPDLNEQELDQALAVIIDNKIDGVIATNTTLSRPFLQSRHASESGGLSGAPLAALSRKSVDHIYARTQGKLPIIAAGGIMSPQDADAAINAGASLVQVFTGLIYRGPGLIKEILGTE